MTIADLDKSDVKVILLSHEEREIHAAAATANSVSLSEEGLNRGEIAFLWLIVLGTLYVAFSYFVGDVLGVGLPG